MNKQKNPSVKSSHEKQKDGFASISDKLCFKSRMKF